MRTYSSIGMISRASAERSKSLNAGMPITPRDLDENFTVEEAFRIGYIPIILVKAAFRFADFATRLCAEKKLPHKKETRMIRQAVQEFTSEVIRAVRDEIQEKLELHTESFFEAYSSDVQTLWYVVNQELKTRHPELSDYDLLTNVYICIALIDCVRTLDAKYNKLIEERTGKRYDSIYIIYGAVIYEACLSIAGRYTIDRTPMISLAMKVIMNKIEDVSIIYISDGQEQP